MKASNDGLIAVSNLSETEVRIYFTLYIHIRKYFFDNELIATSLLDIIV